MTQTTEEIEDLTNKKYLTDLDLAKLNYFTEKKINFDKDEEIANLKLQLIESQKAVITYRVLEDRKRREKTMSEHLELLNTISETNDIPDNVKWSYNQETKEILIDE